MNEADLHKMADEAQRELEEMRSSDSQLITSGIKRFPDGSGEVLGKVGHLFQFTDPTVLRIMSWHLSSRLEMLVCKTSAKAQEIYQSNHQQAVLPLETMSRKHKQRPWMPALPHTHIPNFVPSGMCVCLKNKIKTTLGPSEDGPPRSSLIFHKENSDHIL